MNWNWSVLKWIEIHLNKNELKLKWIEMNWYGTSQRLVLKGKLPVTDVTLANNYVIRLFGLKAAVLYDVANYVNVDVTENWWLFLEKAQEPVENQIDLLGFAALLRLGDYAYNGLIKRRHFIFLYILASLTCNLDYCCLTMSGFYIW